MVGKKRVFISTLFGGILGDVSWILAMMGGRVAWPGIAHQIFIYALMGFVIGISSWKIKWWLHGILIGLLFGISNGLGALWMMEMPGITFVSIIIIGLVLGFLVELITSLGFKARMP
jgi:hypothetical protein